MTIEILKLDEYLYNLLAGAVHNWTKLDSKLPSILWKTL